MIDTFAAQGLSAALLDWPVMEAAADERLETMREALHKIVQWSEAYPLDIFPEPDWAYVRVLLGRGGITVDAVSASCMRRVVEGVGKIAREALK
jgi:hypothetical protein